MVGAENAWWNPPRKDAGDSDGATCYTVVQMSICVIIPPYSFPPAYRSRAWERARRSPSNFPTRSHDGGHQPMTNSERCSVCGAALRDDAPFCVSCGMPRPTTSVPATPAAESAPAPAAPPPTPSSTDAAPIVAPVAETSAPVAEEPAPEPAAAPTPVESFSPTPVEPSVPAPAPAPAPTTPSTPAHVTHATAAPEFKLTAGRAAIGPIILLIALAILVAVIMWIQAGYPLPAGFGL
jgi:hypothetical protein